MRASYARFPYRFFYAALTAKGYVVFININPGQISPQMWFCNTCGERVTRAKQENHARDHR